MKVKSVKLPHYDGSAEKATVTLKTPEKVVLSMSQHGGVPCNPVVEVGDYVKIGQVIGEATAVIATPVHASISGTVTEITEIMNVSGKTSLAVVIKAGDRQEVFESVKPPVINSREDFIEAIKNSGLVGLGGAGFPTYVKLNYDRKTINIDTLIVNGAECEPYITSDYREFIENPEGIITGIKLVMKYLEIPKAVIGIEDDKKAAIQKMTELCVKEQGIKVMVLPSKYPQGAEKVLIKKTTGRTVKEGKLPMSAGCLVLNCSTLSFIAEYVKTGMPLVKRRLTLDGNISNKPQNVFVPIGTTLSELFKIANLRTQADRVVFGGPMMGVAVYDNETPTKKTNNAILFFGETSPQASTNCIRCGKCIRACSMNLCPTELEHAFDAKDADKLKKLHINLCMDCGACSFVCPAKRNLAEKNQLAKNFVREVKGV